MHPAQAATYLGRKLRATRVGQDQTRFSPESGHSRTAREARLRRSRSRCSWTARWSPGSGSMSAKQSTDHNRHHIRQRPRACCVHAVELSAANAPHWSRQTTTGPSADGPARRLWAQDTAPPGSACGEVTVSVPNSQRYAAYRQRYGLLESQSERRRPSEPSITTLLFEMRSSITASTPDP